MVSPFFKRQNIFFQTRNTPQQKLDKCVFIFHHYCCFHLKERLNVPPPKFAYFVLSNQHSFQSFMFGSKHHHKNQYTLKTMLMSQIIYSSQNYKQIDISLFHMCACAFMCGYVCLCVCVFVVENVKWIFQTLILLHCYGLQPKQSLSPSLNISLTYNWSKTI